MIEAEWGSFKYYQLKGENTLQLLGLALQEGVRQMCKLLEVSYIPR